MITDPNPPVLRKVPEATTVKEAARIADGALTIGQERFGAASKLPKDEAIKAYETLIAEYPGSWIDRVSRQRLAELRK